MNEVIITLFGEGKDLNSLQMGTRAFILFFITLFLIRMAGMRAFGTKSAYDNIIVIILGALLSRAIVGASPFLPTVIAGTVLALTHRVLGWIAVRNSTISHFLKGKEMVLYKNSEINKSNLMKCNISYGDLLEGVRLAANTKNLNNVDEIYMERSGQISVVKKEE